MPAYLKPGLPLNRFVTAGPLPPPIREQYGLTWGPCRDRSLTVLLRTIGDLVPGAARRRTPERSCGWPAGAPRRLRGLTQTVSRRRDRPRETNCSAGRW
jgi:uncharacterized protein (DUF2236 family)